MANGDNTSPPLLTKFHTIPWQKKRKHTAEGIRWSSPTQLLVFRSTAYVWQSGRDAQFFIVCGCM